MAVTLPNGAGMPTQAARAEVPPGRRGAVGGFRVQDLKTSLSVLGEGNRDYRASYTVSDPRLVHGG